MSKTRPSPLTVSCWLLEALIALNMLCGFVAFLFLVAWFVAPASMNAWIHGFADVESWDRAWGWRFLYAAGVLIIAGYHRVLIRLRAIVDTVSDGNPFVARNAARLRDIAWTVVAVEGLTLAVGLIGPKLLPSGTWVQAGPGIHVLIWIAILLLFVLAQVFTEGTRMRDELDGTV